MADYAPLVVVDGIKKRIPVAHRLVAPGAVLLNSSGGAYNVEILASGGTTAYKYDSSTAYHEFNGRIGINTLTPEEALDITGNAIVRGNLTVKGTTTTVESTVVQIADNLIILNYGEVGAGVTSGTSGIEVDRGSLNNYFFLFDESDDVFKIGEAASLQKVATREDNPLDDGYAKWSSADHRFNTVSVESFVFWTKTGTTIHPNTLTDVIGIGTDTATAKLHIVGDADIVQLIVKGHSTQTANLTEWQSSAGSSLVHITPSGIIGQGGSNLILSTDAQTGGTNNLVIVPNYTEGSLTGGTNTLMGHSAGTGLTSGSENTMLGYGSGTGVVTGDQNICIGNLTMANNAGGSRNMIFGYLAFSAYSVSASDNVAIGYFALKEGNGDGSVALGSYSLQQSWGGAYNTAIGFKSGKSVTGSSNVLIGSYVAENATNISNQLWIANSNTTTPLVYGEFDNSLFRINGKGEYVGLADALQLKIKGYSTQAENLTEWQNSLGTVLSKIGPLGDLTAPSFIATGSADTSVLANSPTGSVPLAISTVGYVSTVAESIYQSIYDLDQSLQNQLPYKIQVGSISGVQVVDTIVGTDNVDLDGVYWVVTIASLDGVNKRIERILATTDFNSVQYAEDTTSDIGDTSEVELSVTVLNGDLLLRATATSFNWIIKARREVII